MGLSPNVLTQLTHNFGTHKTDTMYNVKNRNSNFHNEELKRQALKRLLINFQAIFINVENIAFLCDFIFGRLENLNPIKLLKECERDRGYHLIVPG